MEERRLFYYFVGILSALGLLSLFVDGEDTHLFEDQKQRNARIRRSQNAGRRRPRPARDILASDFCESPKGSVDGAQSISRPSTPDTPSDDSVARDVDSSRFVGVGEILSPHRRPDRVFTSADLLSPSDSSSAVARELRRAAALAEASADGASGEESARVRELCEQIEQMQRDLQNERRSRRLGEEQVKAEAKLRQDTEEILRELRRNHDSRVQTYENLLSRERSRVQMLQDQVHGLQTQLAFLLHERSESLPVADASDARADSSDSNAVASLNESTDSSGSVVEAAGSEPSSPFVRTPPADDADDTVRPVDDVRLSFASHLPVLNSRVLFWGHEERSLLVGTQNAW